MLQNIRDHAQGFFAWLIFLIISIPFALWGVNEYLQPPTKIAVAEINGKELLSNEFEYNVQQQREQLRKFLPQNSDLSMMDDRIRQGTLKRMIEEEVLVQSALKTGLRISDVFLARRIQELPAFQEDKVFSQPKYESFLHRQGMSSSTFELQIRRALLTDQLREGILRSTPLTQHDVQTQARLDKQQRAISYVIISPEPFKKEVSISETEVNAAYQKDKTTRYMNPEKVSIEYVELSQKNLTTHKEKEIDEATLKQLYQEKKETFTTPPKWHAQHILVAVDSNTPSDKVETAKKKAQDILTKLQAGKSSFEELAKQFSEDPGSSKEGGNLPWFGPGEMAKPFEDAVRTMKVGELSHLVKSQFGFHIIKLLESKPEIIQTFEEVREQLKKDVLKEQAETVFYAQAEQFANLAFEHPNTLEPLSTTLGLKVQSTDFFDKTSTLNSQDPVLSNREVIEVAFSDEVLKDRLNSKVIEIDNQDMIVLRIKDYVEATSKPLSEVKEKIIEHLTQDKAKEKAYSLSKKLLDEIKQKGNPKEVIQAHHLAWSQAAWVNRQDTTLKQPKIVSEAFKMGTPSKNKALYRTLELLDGNYAIIALLAVKDGQVNTTTSTSPPAEKQEQMQQQRALGESEFQQFVAELETQATVKKYPENIKTSSTTTQ